MTVVFNRWSSPAYLIRLLKSWIVYEIANASATCQEGELMEEAIGLMVITVEGDGMNWHRGPNFHLF